MANSKGNPRERSSVYPGGNSNINTSVRHHSRGATSYEDLKLDSSRGAAGAQSGSSYNASYGSASAAVAAMRKRRKRKKVITGVIIGVVVLLLAACVSAFAYIAHLNSNLSNGISDELKNVLVSTDTPSDPFYVLLLGTDGSSVREQEEEFAGSSFRSDSIMLCRIDPKNKIATIVSIPRDTRVDMGEYGYQKINAALALEGPELALKAVSELAGVPISHYAEINFDGFYNIVEALGGIEVDVPMEIDDEEAGGHLDAGLQTLDGWQALILCRSRHSYDDYGAGDLYRTANQRLVLSAIAQKILDADLVTIANTVSAFSEYVTTDMSVSDIVGVAQNMRGLSASDGIYSAVLPTIDEYIDDISYQIVVEDEWTEMMKRVDAGLPPTTSSEIDAATGTVLSNAGSSTDTSVNVDSTATINVRNGSPTSGLAAQAQTFLEEMGYINIDVGNADEDTYTQTLVIYKEDSDAAQAQAMVDKFGVGVAQVDDGVYLFESDFLIVIGSDWITVHPASSSSSSS